MEPNALLFYNGRYNEQYDFISLQIVERQLIFAFSLGDQITTVAYVHPTAINDGDWHRVQISYYNRVR